jgi:hypothetical protein
MRKRSIAGGGVLGLALLLTCACGTNIADGPFGPSGGAGGAVCAWTPAGGVVFYGAEEFPNSGGTGTIEKVSLVAAHHLRIVTGWAVRSPEPAFWGSLRDTSPCRSRSRPASCGASGSY